MERAAATFGDVWRAMPADRQLLAAGAALLAVGFAILFWTPLGNRAVARYCFGLAVLCHLLMWGAARQFSVASGTAMSALPAIQQATEIELPIEESTSNREATEADPLKAAVLDPRDRSAPIEAPRPVARSKDESPLAAALLETPAPTAPPLRKTNEEVLSKTPPLAAAPAMKEDSQFTPAPAAEPQPPLRKEEPKELPIPTPTPRIHEERLAVAPDDSAAEIRVPKLKTATSEPVEITARPIELAKTNNKDDLDFAPAPAPAAPREPKSESAKTSSDGVAAEIGRMTRTSRSDAPLATDSSKQLASALPIPRSAPAEPSLGSSLRLQPATSSSSIGSDIGGAFTPAPAPVDPEAVAGTSGSAGATARRRLGPEGDLSGRRSGDQRRQLLERFGGNAATEQAVVDALAWLAAHQDADGRWDGDGFMTHCPAGDQCEGKAIENGSDVGVSAISLLAFLGAGHTHKEGSHREVVRRGLNWLLTEQGEDGHLMGRQKQGRVYSHAMATLALTEAYQMSADERLKPYCQKAIDWLVRAQEVEKGFGGWRYSPGIDSDTSVFGWCVMALSSARQAGLRVPETCWQRAQKWLPQVSSGDSNGLACYQPGRGPSEGMTAEALVCRQLFGLPRDSETSIEATTYMLQRAPNSKAPNVYYWYYGTVAMFQVGGVRWERWNDSLQQAILPTQRKDGHRKGSWDPEVPWGVDGGRVYATATNALCLEVYYRHLPIYKEASTP